MTIDAVFQRLDPARLTRLLADAVDTYGPSYAESAVVELLGEALDERGLAYRLQRVSEEDESPERHNIIVELGPAPAELLLVGHIDTIPAWDEDSACARIEEGKLYGLGSADMKSGCCAMIEAMRAVADSGVELASGVALALVAGEEEYGDGSEFFLQDHRPGLTVIGEPTGLKPCTEHFGFAEFVLASQGNPAHAAFPELGANAIHAMLGWLSSLLEQMGEVSVPEQIALNPRSITGGGDLFIVADACTAGLDIHLGPKLAHDEIISLLDRTRAGVLAAHPGCRLSFEQTYYAPAYGLDPADPRLAPLRRAFQAADMIWKPTAFRSHSDGNMFRQRGALPIVCGPGRLEVAHTRDEHVDLDELHQAARLYAAMIVAACAEREA
jgi:acetylornithine deacetylase